MSVCLPTANWSTASLSESDSILVSLGSRALALAEAADREKLRDAPVAVLQFLVLEEMENGKTITGILAVKIDAWPRCTVPRRFSWDLRATY
jgi:hypothetical protein